MPNWVKVFIVVGALLLIGLVVTQVAGVDHGPGMHRPGGPGGHTPVEHGP